MHNKNATIPNKTKLLDQMLEDLAGEEFDGESDNNSRYDSDFKRFIPRSEFGEFESIEYGLHPF